MHFTKDDLAAAREAGILDPAVHEHLTGFLLARASGRRPPQIVEATPDPGRTPGPRFDLAHMLWYAGALIVMTAMGIFSTAAFSALGGKALITLGVLYAIGFTLVGRKLWNMGLTTPGGLFITIAVSMAPLVVYGIQMEAGAWNYGDPGAYKDFYKYINGSWVWMEVAAIIASAVALRFFPFGNIAMVASVALWFLSMDIAIWLKGAMPGSDEWELRQSVSLWFGIGMIVFAWILDLKPNRRTDYGFWLHQFGAITFWGAISFRHASSEVSAAIYCAINVGLLLFAVYLGRRVYAVLGTIGVSYYLGHLAWDVFKDALGFTFALTLLGIGVIGLGLLYNRHQATVARLIDDVLPAPLRALRPKG